MKKQNVRTISLIVCTFTYLLVGAAVFDALESETEKKRWTALNDIEATIIKRYNISSQDFKVMETVVLKSEPHKAGKQWKFTGAFYYATTVLTTIGYGHSTPSTIGGKLFTMCYAIVGIPLGLVMFQSIGDRVNRLSSYVIKTVKESLHCEQIAASELDLICVVTTLSSFTIAGGAAAFSKFEGWSYFDSVYYCFITLTTIGFGDMVALQKDNALNDKPEYVMFALIFILLGLAIVAASLNLLVLRFVTMNTEDERRDEAQAMQALQVAVRLEGDVITANGSILSGRIGHDLATINDHEPSICSCRCGCFKKNRLKRHRYKIRRSPSHIKHLLSLGSITSTRGLPANVTNVSYENGEMTDKKAAATTNNDPDKNKDAEQQHSVNVIEINDDNVDVDVDKVDGDKCKVTGKQRDFDIIRTESPSKICTKKLVSQNKLLSEKVPEQLQSHQQLRQQQQHQQRHHKHRLRLQRKHQHQQQQQQQQRHTQDRQKQFLLLLEQHQQKQRATNQNVSSLASTTGHYRASI